VSIDWGALAISKGEPRKRTKARRERQQRKITKDVRAYVFVRENYTCRCCHLRPAESMHEIKPRSLRGDISKKNSIAVCGSGTTGCHGFLQSHRVLAFMSSTGAEGTIRFYPRTEQAADWMLTPVGSYLSSQPERA
jgi:hypothetical protein